MSHFLKVKTAGEVLRILERIRPLPVQPVSLREAGGRFLAEDIEAGEPVPHFARATMDGFAVRARDTFGASESMPALLELGGEVLIGGAAEVSVAPGKAVAIPTGGMLPEGADAVVMVEYTHPLDEGTIEVSRPVAPGDNVLKAGDDIAPGEKIFSGGWRLRPQDIGMLASLGITRVSVFKRPRVALISTGDEIVPVETAPLPPGKVRDINSFTLAAQMESAGAEIGTWRKVPDKLEELVAACAEAVAENDAIVLSGGSSVGVRDYTVKVLERMPESKLLVHGVAIRPGKPTILGMSGEKIFWGLPGQPVSALITCREFVLPSLARLQGGLMDAGPGRGGWVRARLARRLPSVHGRTDYAPVILSESGEGSPEATPIFGKSGSISILARAAGYVVVPEHVEGFDQGAEVSVFAFS